MERKTNWKLKFSKRAVKDWFLLKDKGLDAKAEKLLKILKLNPYQNLPSFEKLVGVEDTYSRRINIQHRFVYRINKTSEVVEILSMFRHYS